MSPPPPCSTMCCGSQASHPFDAKHWGLGRESWEAANRKWAHGAADFTFLSPSPACGGRLGWGDCCIMRRDRTSCGSLSNELCNCVSIAARPAARAHRRTSMRRDRTSCGSLSNELCDCVSIATRPAARAHRRTSAGSFAVPASSGGCTSDATCGGSVFVPSAPQAQRTCQIYPAAPIKLCAGMPRLRCSRRIIATVSARLRLSTS